MQIRIRAFAAIREALGFTEQALDAPGGSTVEDVIALLDAEHPAAGLAGRHFSIAVNRVFVSRDHVLNDGDELALIPPVSGG